MSSRSPWVGATGPRHYRRLAVFTGLLVGGFVVLGVRLVEIQVVQHEELRELAERQRRFTVHQLPSRGRLLDRNGLTLADSALVKTVVADPRLVQTNVWLLATNLAEPLGLDPMRLAGLLERQWRTNPAGARVPVTHVLLQRRVPMTNWFRVQEILSALPVGEGEAGISQREKLRRLAVRWRLGKSIGSEDEQMRFYPGGTLASHVLGFVRANPAAETNRWAEPLVGVEGLECSLNSVLRGIPGTWELEKVRRASMTLVEEGDGFRARPGLDVVLSLDATLQRIVESALKEGFARHQPVSATCVVVRPQTGEILAMACVPDFDPNWAGRVDAPARRNRAILDEYEPGSTFKVVSVSGALDAGVVAPTDRFDCGRGHFVFHGIRMGDDHPSDVLSVEQVIAKSSNIGAAKIGIQMGEELLYRSITNFGLGRVTGIPLPWERSGTVHPLKKWSKISVAWIPMGHEVTATPLQMTLAMAAVANEGRLMRPLLVRRIEDATGRAVRVFEPAVERQVIREETARSMTKALRLAVESGTGIRAQLEDYPVAGKTGTAEKTRAGGGYAKDRRNFASFIGFLPADDPQLCIGVFLDEPRSAGRYGGETSAPIFREIAQHSASYLGLPSSRPTVEESSRLAAARAEPGKPRM